MAKKGKKRRLAKKQPKNKLTVKRVVKKVARPIKKSNLTLTEEQNKIIRAEGNLAINAFSGSGKTEVLVQYAKTRPDKSFIYLCFNRSVKEAAKKRFPPNVVVNNFHSLAFRTMGVDFSMVRPVPLLDLIDLLGIPDNPKEENYQLKIASWARTFVSIFCSGREKNISDLDLYFIDSDFFKEHYDVIRSFAQKYWNMMVQMQCPITHDFYLKVYQLTGPILDYDYIFYDEFQDTDVCSLDIFLTQRGNKIAVGDTHQSIYAFRRAVDGFGWLPYAKQLSLTRSFRFRQDIADYANQILELKNKYLPDKYHSKIKGVGVGNSSDIKTKAFIARTNVELINKCTQLMMDNPTMKFYFEGDFKSYFSGPLWDIYNLFMGERRKINNPLIRKFGSLESFKDFVQETQNMDYALFIQVVEQYKTDLPNIFFSIRDKLVAQSKADVTFTTVHKAKGLEYDCVELGRDFIAEDAIHKTEEPGRGVNESVNLLYIAATRAKNKLVTQDHFLFDAPKLGVSKAEKIL